jgi:hypothetical protein
MNDGCEYFGHTITESQKGEVYQLEDWILGQQAFIINF